MIVSFQNPDNGGSHISIFVNGTLWALIGTKPHASCNPANPTEIVPPMVMLLKPATELMKYTIGKKVCQREGTEREVVFRDPPPQIPARMRIR